jgi:hypothetical protein
LWKSSVTQEQVNIAEKAHIYSFGEGGPRGHEEILDEKINDMSNLLLVCEECHKSIDKEKDGGRYTAVLLQRMKSSHERRIEIVTGIDIRKQSHIVLYGANVGDHSSPLSFDRTASALFPDHYPGDDKGIELATVNSSFTDRNPEFWKVEQHGLNTKFNRRVRERLTSGEASHLSIFALAPQPLLILLGTLLTDIPNADVFQLHREPQGWEWPNGGDEEPFRVVEPIETAGIPALVLSLSANISADRIESVLGKKVSIWNVTIPAPHNDFVKSRGQLSSFRKLMRPLMDRVKAKHGQNTTLHIFPAVPVSIAVELGRVRMPKADMPWKIYDQVNVLGGFIPATIIPEGSEE